MHSVIKEAVDNFSAKSIRAEGWEHVIEELEETDANMRIDFWADLMVSYHIDHVNQIAPILRTLCSKFGRPITKTVDVNRGVFHFRFKCEHTFEVDFYLTEGASCKLIEKGSHIETKKVIEYEMVCTNGGERTMTNEEICDGTE